MTRLLPFAAGVVVGVGFTQCLHVLGQRVVDREQANAGPRKVVGAVDRGDDLVHRGHEESGLRIAALREANLVLGKLGRETDERLELLNKLTVDVLRSSRATTAERQVHLHERGGDPRKVSHVTNSRRHDSLHSSVAPTPYVGHEPAVGAADAPEAYGAAGASLPPAAPGSTETCACGCPDAYALTPGEVLVHHPDGCRVHLIGGAS